MGRWVVGGLGLLVSISVFDFFIVFFFCAFWWSVVFVDVFWLVGVHILAILVMDGEYVFWFVS